MDIHVLMKILDILESVDTDISWLDSRIKDLIYAINHFDNLVDIKGYNQARKENQKKINQSKSTDWYYDMLSQTDDTIKSKHARLINVRDKLEKLVNSGLSYE
jgi:disulfide oxidoreductase YuzD